MAVAVKFTDEDVELVNEFISKATIPNQAYYLGIGTVAAKAAGLTPTRGLYQNMLNSTSVAQAAEFAEDWVAAQQRRLRKR